MRINNQKSYQNTNSINFSAGMTQKIALQIQNTDTFKISNDLAKKGIDSDFKGNKTVAWCSNKVVEIFEQINNLFGEKIKLPKGIYVEDFGKLNIQSKGTVLGLCNFFPAKLYKNSDKILNGNVVLFNTFETEMKNSSQNLKQYFNWDNINEISDIDYYYFGIAATPHFLNTFIHEFAHAAHENNISDKIGGKNLLKLFEKALSDKSIQKFQNKNEKLLSKEICKYAAKSPFEAIACDIPQKVVKSLDEDLSLTSNPFENTIYSINKIKTPEKSATDSQKRNSDTSVLQVCKPCVSSPSNTALGSFAHVPYRETSSDKILEKIWNGKL